MKICLELWFNHKFVLYATCQSNYFQSMSSKHQAIQRRAYLERTIFILNFLCVLAAVVGLVYGDFFDWIMAIITLVIIFITTTSLFCPPLFFLILGGYIITFVGFGIAEFAHLFIHHEINFRKEEYLIRFTLVVIRSVLYFGCAFSGSVFFKESIHSVKKVELFGVTIETPDVPY